MYIEENIKKLLKKTIINIILIIVLTIFLGYCLSIIFLFNQESLYWLASTIVQAFGALIAIFVTIGFYFLNRIQEAYKIDIDVLKEMITDTKGLNESQQKNFIDTLPELFNSSKEWHQQKLDETRNSIFEATILIAILIVSGSIIISFIHSILRFEMPFIIDSNVILSGCFIFLILLSIFSLYKLLKTMTKVYDIQYKFKRKNRSREHN